MCPCLLFAHFAPSEIEPLHLGCCTLRCCCCHQVSFNPAEVSEVKFIELPDLVSQMAAEPGNFTEWFRDELALLCFFGCKEGNGRKSSGQQQQQCAGDPNLN
jgi:isopentenyldiphosphate isomerase